jgi:enamine deaminase RidA (YjgF/YER057c/UK114 family)
MPAETLPERAGKGKSPSTIAPAQIRREHCDGLALTRVESTSGSVIHLTVTPQPGEAPASMVRRMAAVLNECEATVVQQIVFGSVRAHKQTMAALRQALDDPDLPVTWVEGATCGGHPISGMQVHALSGTEVQSVGQNDAARGRVWNDAVSTHLVLGALGPTHITAGRPEQARETFENLQAGLTEIAMTMKDVARTWFFLDDIVSWYGDFNGVRNDFFARSELRPGGVPASTGVSGRNPARGALTGAAWAVRAHDPSAKIVEIVPSPCQCPAPAYGSAFSRAVELKLPGYRQILVSGTASIEPGGRTAHVGDVRAQIGLSMQVVEAILASRGMALADVSRATAYFKSPADTPVFDEWLARHELRAMPMVRACCDICRDDLLFEIELDAIKSAS